MMVTDSSIVTCRWGTDSNDEIIGDRRERLCGFRGCALLVECRV